ncbi:MAG: type ISP restriction/modification enzyme, partial [Armatimonadota bacterium]
LGRINRRDLKKKYAEDLFCNEIMLLPYYIASLNIEHEYFKLTDEYKPFEGICFTDTLDLAEAKQFGLFSEENTARVAREKDAEITVIVGNPPYNVGQRNENDNNKNRRYEVIDKRVRETYAKDSKATNKNALYDAYVKFFRWATDRLQGRNGIICFVSNNSFIDQIAFDGMRKHLTRDFTQIYHLDLLGNFRKKSNLTVTSSNVFGITVGVGITIAVRNSGPTEREIRYFRLPETWTRYDKCEYLAKQKSAGNLHWNILTPDKNNTWLTEGLRNEFTTFQSISTKGEKTLRSSQPPGIFRTYGGGVKTNRDEWTYDFDRSRLIANVRRFIETYNSEVDRWQRRKDRDARVDDFVLYDDRRIKWSATLKQNLIRGIYAEYAETRIRKALYRPYCKQFLFFDRLAIERVYGFPHFLPTTSAEDENRIIWLKTGLTDQSYIVISNSFVDIMPNGGSQCFPFYTYAEDGTNRRENITDWALAQFRKKYGKEVSKWDIFYFVYALLHHPVYRERYAENLKRELPRIPMTVSPEDFPTYAEIGRKLADLHLNYETIKEYPLDWIENNSIPFSWRVEKMRLSKDKSTLVVNDSLTLTGFPPECFNYRLGNRSALEWVIDQYRISTDKRSGITSDPNRADDQEYIIRLVGRVVTVSVETVKLIQALPDLGIQTD